MSDEGKGRKLWTTMTVVALDRDSGPWTKAELDLRLGRPESRAFASSRQVSAKCIKLLNFFATKDDF